MQPVNIIVIKDKEPMFSFSNFFRPTTKNVLIWGTTIKGLAATAGVTAVANDEKTIFWVAFAIGGLTELFIQLTKQEPIETIQQAVEDLKEDTLNPTIENVSN